MHALQQIVEGVATALTPVASTGTWISLYKTRIPPKGIRFPFVQVFAVDENSEIDENSIGACILNRRTATIAINGAVNFSNSKKETIEASMFAIAEEIETRLTSASLAGIKIQDFHLDNTEFEVELDDNELPAYGAILQSWTFTYYTEVGSPETLI